MIFEVKTESYEGKFMNERKRFLTILFIMVMVVCFIGCSKKEPQITGKWVCDDGKEYFDLYSDGSGVIGNTNTESEDYLKTLPLTWIAEGERFKVNVDFGSMGASSVSFTYALTDTTLILTYDDGTEKKYIKEE